jgi:uncharacterized protein DUF4446
MPSIHFLITIFNSLAFIYLIFLFYKKNDPKGKSATVNPNLTHQIKKIDNCLQKTSFTRFNPFNDVGGDQSFILVLLDNTNSGVIITSLHNRNNTRIYAKQIKNGQGKPAALSKEEKTALKKAIKNYPSSAPSTIGRRLKK